MLNAKKMQRCNVCLNLQWQHTYIDWLKPATDFLLMIYSQNISYTYVQFLVTLSATTAAAATLKGKSLKHLPLLKQQGYK